MRAASYLAMKRLAFLLAAMLLACLLPLSAEISGTFRGIIVHAPKGEATYGWIYVEGRNGNLRRAEVSHAQVLYSSSVPVRLRAKDPAQGLKEGAEVRVTASQDGDGEWRASRVEILKVGQVHRRKRPQVRPASDRSSGLNSALWRPASRPSSVTCITANWGELTAQLKPIIQLKLPRRS